MTYDPRSSLGCLASIACHMNERSKEIMNMNKEFTIGILYVKNEKDESYINLNGRKYKINLRKIESSLYLPRNSIAQGDILEFIFKNDSNIIYCVYPKPSNINDDWIPLYSYKHYQWYWYNVQTGLASWNTPTIV
tara:strand:+ start:286 stop:690 length:405 start_codon:yes stop_codon:yes gene_type:complete